MLNGSMSVPLLHEEDAERLGLPGREPVPEFSDGYWVTRLAYYEAIAYGDMWALYTIANGIGHLVGTIGHQHKTR